MAKILYAEDEEDLATMLIQWLKSESHTVEAVNSGADALEQLAFVEYDIVILDWNLPIVDGIQVTRTFRSSNSKTPIVLLTGAPLRTVQSIASAAGANRVYTKPPDFDILSKCIRELCGSEYS